MKRIVVEASFVFEVPDDVDVENDNIYVWDGVLTLRRGIDGADGSQQLADHYISHITGNVYDMDSDAGLDFPDCV